jgi:phosphatidylserine decarboxylase
MGAFAEAGYMAWEQPDPAQQFPIKGHSLDAGRVLGSEALAQSFAGGPVVLARLSPTDYHHVHYFDEAPHPGATPHWRASLDGEPTRFT